MKTKDKEIFVFAHWEDFEIPTLIGTLNINSSKGKEIFSFKYDEKWLKKKYFAIDPELQLFSGYHYHSKEKPNFGIFTDSAPDRWGRVLMKRLEVQKAKNENRPVRNLYESDFLLGVYDKNRMGGLRFKTELDGTFLDDDFENATPPLAKLRELEQVSLKLETNDAELNKDYSKWLNCLIRPGSSLGGARPKSNIVDKEGDLWIAKFPSKNDEFDSGAWEMVIYELAIKCGVDMSKSKTLKFSNVGHTFLTKRFDRTDSHKRVHFSSAMTLLGFSDGDNYETGASYLDLAQFIIQNCSNVKEDLEQLWRRIVFNICVSNTDDHLRNHGFILKNNSWKLSPAYDINPNPYRGGLSLNISEDDNSLDLSLAKEISPLFRLTEIKTDKIIDEVLNAVKNWEIVAKKNKLKANEIEAMRTAFIC